MTTVDGNLICEMLKRIQSDMGSLKKSVRDLRQDNLSLRNQFHTMQGDLNHMCGSIAHIEDRIEYRLEPRELAEAQSRFDPHP